MLYIRQSLFLNSLLDIIEFGMLSTATAWGFAAPNAQSQPSKKQLPTTLPPAADGSPDTPQTSAGLRSHRLALPRAGGPRSGARTGTRGAPKMWGPTDAALRGRKDREDAGSRRSARHQPEPRSWGCKESAGEHKGCSPEPKHICFWDTSQGRSSRRRT